MKNLFWLIVFGVLINSFLVADDFDFKDPKGVNSISIKLDSPLEPINGIASGLSGKVSFDGKDGKSLKGEISLAVDSLRMPNDKMSEVVKSEAWLDLAKNPNIKVTLKEVTESKAGSDNEFILKVKSEVEIKGITKEMVIEIKATYLKDKLGERVQKQKGDLLVLRTNFTVKRDDFKIKAGEMLSVIANDIEISANITGSCAK